MTQIQCSDGNQSFAGTQNMITFYDYYFFARNQYGFQQKNQNKKKTPHIADNGFA